MGKVPRDDIVAYCVEDKIVCDDCIKSEELIKIREQDIILLSEKECAFYFCDRCKKQIA
ncbi:MAG: hypothetical protein ABIH18_02215 [Candidatus Omnitrophota bacterium]